MRATRFMAGLGLLLWAAPPVLALTAPNVVVIDARLVTSGQPPAEALERLGAEGFEAVVYLAPASVSDAVREEPAILRRQGIEFVAVPIPFGAPTPAHFQAVAEALDRLKARKVLVHCQVNMRASTMVFLYRVLRRAEPPSLAYESVIRVWSPQGPWKEMAEGLLKARGVNFELY